TAASNSSIAFNLRITNNSDADFPLDGLSVRYYLTSEVDTPLVVELDYGAVSAPMQGLSGPTAMGICSPYGKATANDVCQIDVKNLQPMAPGANLILTQRTPGQQYPLLNQSNDYSFDPTKTMFTPWERIAVFRDTALLAGKPP